MNEKSMQVVDQELMEQMYKAIKGLNDGLAEIYRITQQQRQVLADLHARVDNLENQQK
jgi:uncharacterized coiled-coil protein SlyX